MRVFILLAAAVFCFALSARADLRESDESYYGRLMKSCEYATRESWRDYLLFVPHKRLDECCASSVRTMAAAHARLANNSQCPAGQRMNMQRCETTKQWCEPVK